MRLTVTEGFELNKFEYDGEVTYSSYGATGFFKSHTGVIHECSVNFTSDGKLRTTPWTVGESKSVSGGLIKDKKTAERMVPCERCFKDKKPVFIEVEIELNENGELIAREV